MRRIILFAPVLLLIYINSFAGGTTGSTKTLAVVANFTASVTTGCAPLTTQFTSTSTSDAGDPIVSYNWDFGDLTTSTAPSPSHTYTAEGDYTVKLTVTTQSGATNTITKSDYISAYDKPVFSFGPDYTICEGQTVTLQTIVGAGYVYNWTGVAATTWQATASPSAGLNTYSAEVQNGTCSYSDTIHITADPVFNPDWEYSILSTCGNVLVEFRDVSTSCDPSNNFYPEWLIDGTDYYVDSTILHYTFSTGGNHDVTFLVGDDYFNSAQFDTTINLPNPTAGPSPINLGGDKTICQGNSVQLDAGDEPGATYVWSPAIGLSSTSIYNPIASPSSTQTYSVTKTKCGISVSGTVKVNVNPPLTVNLGPDMDFCGGFITLDAGVTGATYQWGSTYMSGFYATETSQTTDATGAGTYWVTVTKNGCTVSDTIVLNKKKAITASFTYTKSGDGTCGPFVVNVTENATLCSGSVLEHSWNFGDGTIISGTYNKSLIHTYATPGTYIITLIVTNTSAVKDTISQTVTFTGSSITVNVTSSADAICSGDAVTLDAGNPGATYSWSPGGATTQTITVNPTSNTTYTVTVTKGGCSSTGSKTITVTPKPVVNLGAGVTICSGDAVTLDAGNPGATYSWSPGGATTQTITVNPTSNTTYTVTVTQGGCSATGSKTITVTPKPVVNLGAGVTICSGDTVTLDAGNPGATYSWSPGGATTQTITVNPTSNTTYTVTVTQGGCSATGSKTITVTPKPVVNLGADMDFCAGFITLDAGVTGATYQWGSTYMSGFYGTETDQTTDAMGAGTYWVTVNKNGCKVSDTIVLNKKKAITASFTYTQTGSGSCGPYTVNVTENATICSGSVKEHYWDFGDGTVVGGTYNKSLAHNYAVPGDHVIKLVVTNTSGVKDTTEQTVSFTGSGFGINLGNDTTLCAGASITLDAGSATSYAWSTGEATRTITVNQSGEYSVAVYNGVCYATGKIKVTAIAGLSVDLGKDTTVCGGNLVLDAGNSGATYLWNANAGSATSQTVTVTPQNGVNVYAVNVEKGMCKGTDTIMITVNSTIPVNLGNDTAICAGTTLVLDAGYPGAVYSWQDGSTGQTYPANAAGKYKVSVDRNGCKGDDEINITLLSPPSVVDLGDDINKCFGNNITLDAGDHPGATYLWNTGETTRTLNVTTSGNYSVAVAACGVTQTDAINVTLSNLTAPVITQSGLELICTDADSYQWYKDGIFIPGATSKKYKPKGYGKYAVLVTNTALGCSGKSDDYWFTPDGQYYLQEIRVIATPNPSNGLSKLILSKVPPKPVQVSVYDRIGRKILTTTAVNTVTDLNLLSFAKGLYFVECVLGEQKVIIPIVTQ